MPTDFPCPACAAPIPVGEEDLKRHIICAACQAEVRVLLMVMPTAVPAPIGAAAAAEAVPLNGTPEPLPLEPLPLPEEFVITCPSCGQRIEAASRPGEAMQCLRCLHEWDIPHPRKDEWEEEDERHIPRRRDDWDEDERDDYEPPRRRGRDPNEPPKRSIVPALLFTTIFLGAIAGFVFGAIHFLGMREDKYQVAGYVCISGAVWTTLLTAIYFYRGFR